MAHYRVTVRGSVHIGEQLPMPREEARNLRPLGPKAVEADTPQEAAADVLAAFPKGGVVDLVYVQERNGAGGVELF